MRTEEGNQKVYIDILITNLTGSTIPAGQNNSNSQYSTTFIKESYSIDDSQMVVYSQTNTWQSTLYGQTVSTFSLRRSVDTNSVVRPCSLYQKAIQKSKTDTVTIATVAPGTSSYAVTNNVNRIVPAGFQIQATTTKPRTKVGFIYE